MHPRVTLTALLAGLILMGLPAGAVEYEKKVTKSIRFLFTGAPALKHTKFSIPENIKTEIEEKVKQKFISRSINLWQVKSNNIPKGYVVVDHAPSKTQLFTFMVVFDASGAILMVKVLRYREEYGGEIKNKRWLKQFAGKDSQSTFMPEKDIDAISGATLSARAITTAIKKLTLLIGHIISEGEG